MVESNHLSVFAFFKTSSIGVWLRQVICRKNHISAAWILSSIDVDIIVQDYVAWVKIGTRNSIGSVFLSVIPVRFSFFAYCCES